MVDDGVARAHPKLLTDIETYATDADGVLHMTAPVLVLPGGEEVKNDARHLERHLQRLHDAALCRQSFVVVVGGGAVLDAVGYAAATAHRGLRLIRVPTTVLAQDDSAMGVKNGINAFGKKNYLGAFAPPFAVINDFDFLPTLARSRLVERRLGGRQGGAHQGSGFLRSHRAPGREARRPRPGRDGGRDPAIGRAAPVAHRDGGRPVRAVLVASAGLRPLGRAQARAAQPSSAAAWRGRRHRHCPRQHLLVSLGVARRKGVAADHRPAAAP